MSIIAGDPAPSTRYIKLQSDDTLIPAQAAKESLGNCLNPQMIVNNHVRTAKYTRFTFLPLVLFEQFQKKANFYFLLIAILSWTPVSPRSPLTSTTPLVFVLTVSAIKEAWEDWSRHKQDTQMNTRPVWKFDKARKQFVREESQNILVGDVIRVEQNEMFPADILLLQSALPKGTTFIETANLDGETNLKVRQAVPPTYSVDCDYERKGEDYPPKVAAVIQSDLPSAKMQENGWKGTMIGFASKNAEHVYNPHYKLEMANLCLRGTQLRNTPWAIGVVIFTGVETKIMLNSHKMVFKRSNVDRIVDKMLYFIFLFQAIICSIAVVMYYRWLGNNRDQTWYLGWEFDDKKNWSLAALNFFTFLILIDILVPISLYVSMEVVKFIQAWLITQDVEMYHEETDTPAKARTSNLNEELGQVDYVFSDKTGTLTQNKMEFLRCFVANKEYGPQRMNLDDEKRAMPKFGQGIPRPTSYAFEDTRIMHELREDKQRGKTIDLFLTCLATCHEVIPEKRDDGSLEYQSSSPDEKALVNFAKSQQYYFTERVTSEAQVKNLRLDNTSVVINVGGLEHKFQIYTVLPFSSARKRMSVVVLDPRDNKFKMFCKGADNIIEERLSEASRSRDWEAADQALKVFATKGLRTLVCGYRVLEKEKFFNWLVKHQGILTNPDNIANRDRDTENSMAELESELELVGCTAIEDKLQDGVPETIHKLHQGNMKCWMLTGDKVETAKNIGITCRLITHEMLKTLETFDPKHPEGTQEAKKQRLLKERVDRVTQTIRRRKREEGHRTEGGDFHQGIVVSGRAIELVFPAPKMNKTGREESVAPEEAARDEQLQRSFFDLCELCNAVVCCRISPKQKAQIVNLVKKYRPNSITLAIGDGANDVAMIKAAHVGIGISGLEGLQAVMASDYAIAQFRFLQNLLFVHGAWSYRRISVLILYSFYKNVCLTMSQVWFAFYNGWSGQIFYDAWMGAMYNVIYTSLPILCAAILNRDYSYKTALEYPALYRDGQENRTFNIQLFVGYFFQGLLHSICLFFVTLYGMPDISSGNGQPVDMWMVSTTMYTACNLVVTGKICLLTTTWTTLSVVITLLSVLAWFTIIYVYCLMWQITPAMYGVAQRLFSSEVYWMVVFLCCCLTLLPDIAIEYIKKEHWPSRVDLVRRDRRARRGKKPGHILLDSNQPSLVDSPPLNPPAGGAAPRPNPRFEPKHQLASAIPRGERKTGQMALETELVGPSASTHHSATLLSAPDKVASPPSAESSVSVRPVSTQTYSPPSNGVFREETAARHGGSFPAPPAPPRQPSGGTALHFGRQTNQPQVSRQAAHPPATNPGVAPVKGSWGGDSFNLLNQPGGSGILPAHTASQSSNSGPPGAPGAQRRNKASGGIGDALWGKQSRHSNSPGQI